MVTHPEGDRGLNRPEIVVIGVTECGRKFDGYVRWIEDTQQQCRIIRLSAALQNQAQVEECDGVLLTGGGDIHPRFFGRPELTGLLDPGHIDERRDEFELEVLTRMEHTGAPLLGICRGLQVANVRRGGSLIPDLSDEGKAIHTVQGDGPDRMHAVRPEPGSMLQKMTGTSSGIVNSSHHQAVDRVGGGLTVGARSDDGVIESLESDGSGGEGYTLLVQWHPERLESGNIFSSAVRSGFLEVVRNFLLSH